MLTHRSITYRYLKNCSSNTLRSCSSSTPSGHTPVPATASSTKHHDLPTFLHHAHSTALPPSSTVHVGTSYEYLCAQTLLNLGFRDLTRTGGRSDRGIDLVGRWVLPSSGFYAPSSKGEGEGLPVIVQCKATARKPGPEMIRELEGAVVGAVGVWRGDDTIGVLCAKREATEGLRQAVKRSGRGVVWVMVEDLGEGEERGGGRVKQVLWNERVGKVVGARVGAGLRYVMGKGGMDKEVCLTLDGRVWEPGHDGPE